jgi:hypothetical protein
MFCFSNKKHDDYLNQFILPNIDENLNDYDTIKEEMKEVIEKCIKVREDYMKQLYNNGYKELKEEDVFENFPINVCKDLKLLGNYISNLPYCKFLERQDNFLVIKLDQQSKYDELNFLSKILRENISFHNLTLVFNINDNIINFLEVSHIIFNNVVIDINNEMWIELVQSAFTELTLILSIEHAVWHLIVSHIIYISKRCLCNTEILKIFNIADDNVFIKSFEVKTLLFGTSFIFKQILNLKKEFRTYLTNKISNFIDNFNIDTIYNNYFNIDERYLDKKWNHGMKQNIEIIKSFINNIISKKNLEYENLKFTKYISNKYKSLKLNNIPTIQKFLQILFVVGTAFHSTTFEFTKIIMTDVFYNEKLNKIFYGISLQTIVTNINKTFGDKELYKGKLYKDDIELLYNDIEENRKKILNEYDNLSYKNNIYTTRDNMLKTYSTHTYTTYV